MEITSSCDSSYPNMDSGMNDNELDIPSYDITELIGFVEQQDGSLKIEPR